MFSHGKAHIVKPQAKANYIRPFNEKNVVQDQSSFDDLKKNIAVTMKTGFASDAKSLVSSISESKEKHLKNLEVAHTNLSGEIDKIQFWKASVELECSSKAKKLDELNQVAVCQRKTLLELQIKNEDLQSNLKEEIQKRVFILKKFHDVRKLFSVVNQRLANIQAQIEKGDKIKRTFKIANEQQFKILEDFAVKFNCMRLECSEKISHLQQSFMDEKKNSLVLKELCEKQNQTMEKEHKSYCALIEKFQDEVKILSKELESEAKKSLCLQHDKNDLVSKVSDLEGANEDIMKKLQAAKQELEALETYRKKFELEVEKSNDLNNKCEEYLAALEKQKSEFLLENNCLKESVNMLENSVSEQKSKVVILESEKKDLSTSLQKLEDEKKVKESLLEEVKIENLKLNQKIKHDAEIFESSMKQLADEKSELSKSLQEVEEKLNSTLSEKEHLLNKLAEKQDNVLDITQKYEIVVSEINELKIESKELQEKVIILEQELKMKDDLLSLKDEHIKDLVALEKELSEVQQKNRNLESSVQLKQELLFQKELKIEEMIGMEQKCAMASEKIAKLEKIISEKDEVTEEKQKMIADLEADLNQVGKVCEELRYENSFLKEDLQKAETSICLDCEDLKQQLQEFGFLKDDLEKTQEELAKKSNDAQLALKLLSEVETNFDNMCVCKEKEISKLKDAIEVLEKDLMITKVYAEEAERLKEENRILLSKNEEMSIKNDLTFSRLKEKSNSLKVNTEASEKPKIAKYISPPDNKKMEPDSSNDVKKKTVRKPSTPIAEKRKAMWDSESEGSDCLQIVFDSRESGIKFRPQKRDFILKKTPETPKPFDKKNPPEKMDTPAEFVKWEQNENHHPIKESNSNAFNDFLCSNTPQTPCSTGSPFVRRKMPTPKTPTLSGQKKFFKTPLKERELIVKKPETNLWF